MQYPEQYSDKTGESRQYWTHGVEKFPSPVAQFRMAQLVDYDERLYENARIVYRFLVGWYHDQHGDALISQRHVAKVMKQRAPDGAAILSNRTVGRAIITLMETGWVARTFKGRGKGKGASRYVPVINVLELAAQGEFPEPGHSTVPVELSHSNGPLVGHANGPVESEPGHSIGSKTLPPDSATEPKTGVVDNDFAMPARGLSAGAAAKEGFEELFEAYGVRHDKADARRAYEKLAPDADMHNRMVAAAQAWRRSAGAIERMRLRRWIEEERYDEDPKGERKPRERKAANTNKPPPKPADLGTIAGIEDAVLGFSDGSPCLWPVGRHAGEFIKATTGREASDEWVTLDFRIAKGERTGEIISHRFFTQAFVQSVQEEGQKTLSEICAAAGLSSVDDACELLHKPIVAIADGQRVTYRKAEVA